VTKYVFQALRHGFVGRAVRHQPLEMRCLILIGEIGREPERDEVSGCGEIREPFEIMHFPEINGAHGDGRLIAVLTRGPCCHQGDVILGMVRDEREEAKDASNDIGWNGASLYC